ncbi:hypothetical protein [Devosia lacusdianchii]|uniref:hypothetical protein n=1 Tax=Devosia lacusdianchii TaxID=2917991 RepID=UPI001F05A229|nr:hypothetical protein [Devosia sp. JXJ CY 41]
MVTREELYELVWSQPMTKVCEQFSVSSSYMARVCSLLNVPRPPRGYWAKLAVGKAPAAEGLPDALPGDHLTWNEKGEPLPASPPTRPAIPRRQRSATRKRVPSTDVHELIRNARAEFLRSRPRESGGYLKPSKRLLPDISASEAQLDRVLGVASTLYNQLDTQGARVLVAPGDRRWHSVRVDEREAPDKAREYSHRSSAAWSPMRPTVAFFENAAIAITVVEMSAEVTLRYVGGHYIRETEYQANPRKYRYPHSFTTTAELPIGRIRIFASTTEGGDWSASWQEKSEGTIEAMLPRIAREIRGAIPIILERAEEARRQAEIRRKEWEAEQDRWRRQEDRRRIEESTKQSKDALGQVIERWRERMAVEHFLDELAAAIEQASEPERSELMERLRLAREFVGTADALDFFRGWRTPTEIYTPVYPDESKTSS